MPLPGLRRDFTNDELTNQNAINAILNKQPLVEFLALAEELQAGGLNGLEESKAFTKWYSHDRGLIHYQKDMNISINLIQWKALFPEDRHEEMLRILDDYFMGNSVVYEVTTIEWRSKCWARGQPSHFRDYKLSLERLYQGNNHVRQTTNENAE